MNLQGWLRALGLERYEAAFRENAIDVAVLLNLTAEDLKDLGVNLVGHRHKLLNAIAKLRTAPPDVLSTTDESLSDSAERRQRLRELAMQQVAPRAPWEIRRCDLDAEPVRSILDHLRRTGKLVLDGGDSAGQMPLFPEKQGDDNARHHA